MKHVNPFDIVCAMNIGAAMRAKLVLMRAGSTISAGYVKIFKHNDSLDVVKQSLRDAGFYFVEINKIEGNPSHICTLAVSYQEEFSLLLKIATEAFDYEKIGELVGYPPSAVKAYVTKRELFPSYKYTADMKNNPLSFKFSTAWGFECSTLYDWMAKLKAYTPELYNELFAHLSVK